MPAWQQCCGWMPEMPEEEDGSGEVVDGTAARRRERRRPREKLSLFGGFHGSRRGLS